MCRYLPFLTHFLEPEKATLSDTEYFISYFDEAVESLRSKNISPAAVIVDPIFSSSGVLDPPTNFLKVLFFSGRIGSP